MRERLDQQQLTGTGKELQMKALSVVLSNTWLYSLVGNMARLALRVLPKFLTQNPLTPAGQWAATAWNCLKLRENPSGSFTQNVSRSTNTTLRTARHKPSIGILMLKFETSAVLPCSAAALRRFLGMPGKSARDQRPGYRTADSVSPGNSAGGCSN
ncbi:MAG UNVERIFIED_CONTAM: hypothetical protein LVR18_45275 [Planctomycetaceae bacterium]